MDKVYEKLKEQLADMTEEEKQAEWEALKKYNEIGPTVSEYLDYVNSLNKR